MVRIDDDPRRLLESLDEFRRLAALLVEIEAAKKRLAGNGGLFAAILNPEGVRADLDALDAKVAEAAALARRLGVAPKERLEDLADAKLVQRLQGLQEEMRGNERDLLASLVARLEKGAALSGALRDLAIGLVERLELNATPLRGAREE